MLRVVRLVDGRTGHENMTLALVEALARRVPLQVTELDCRARGPRLSRAARHLLVRGAPGRGEPVLAVGAGQRTHLPLLAVARHLGARSIVLLRPSLPAPLYDLCLVPEHDLAPRPGKGKGALPANVIPTRGVLNRLRPTTEGRGEEGLFLVGGPSRHHDWLDREVVRQIALIVARDPGRRWIVATSRRTPRPFLEVLTEAGLEGVQWVAPGCVDRAWLPRRLARAGVAWVSEDSVSMVYEALTAGTPTGLLRVPRRRPDRLTRGLALLLSEGRVGLAPDPTTGLGGRSPREGPPLAEAERCAGLVLERWRGWLGGA